MEYTEDGFPIYIPPDEDGNNPVGWFEVIGGAWRWVTDPTR